MSSNPIMFVFWKYDTFPYVLGAEAEILPDGTCYVKSYQMKISQGRLVGYYSLESGRLIKKVLDRETERVQKERARVEMEAEFRIGTIFHEYNAYRGLDPLKVKSQS